MNNRPGKLIEAYSLKKTKQLDKAKTFLITARAKGCNCRSGIKIGNDGLLLQQQLSWCLLKGIDRAVKLYIHNMVFTIPFVHFSHHKDKRHFELCSGDTTVGVQDCSGFI